MEIGERDKINCLVFVYFLFEGTDDQGVILTWKEADRITIFKPELNRNKGDGLQLELELELELEETFPVCRGPCYPAWSGIRPQASSLAGRKSFSSSPRIVSGLGFY